MEWKVERQAVELRLEMETGLELAARADRIRPTATGVHARISILQAGRIVAYDSFNVERERERIHLINSAAGKLPKGELSKPAFALFVHDFCLEFWGHWSGQFDAEELVPDGDIEPPSLLLAPYCPEGGGVIFFAPPGKGKSWLALLMAQSVNHGVGHYWPVRRQPVVFVNLERSRESVRRRLALVNQQLGLAVDASLLTINARGRSLVDVVDRIARAVEGGAQVVWLDSVSRAGYGSLVQDDTANRIMDELNGVAPSWCAVGHTSRADDSHLFGSQMFDAAADVAVQVQGQKMKDGKLGVGLRVTKANDIAFPPLAIWAMEFDQYGLSDFRPARAGEFPDIEGEDLSAADQVERHLLDFGADDATAIAEALGLSRQNVSTLLNADPRFARQGKDGRRVLYAIRDDRYATPRAESISGNVS